jgi:hypothetical protein
MRKLNIILCMLFLLPLSALAGGQWQMGNRNFVPAASACPFTDSFSGTGALSSSWSNMTNAQFTTSSYSLVKASGTVTLSSGASVYVRAGELVTNSTCTFPLDQYAQATVPAVTDTFGLSVLMTTAGTGYAVRWSQKGYGYIWSYTNGSGGSISSACGTVAAGNSIKLVVTGSGGTQTITAYVNTGSGFVSVCAAVNSAHTTGYPGMFIDNSNVGPPTTLSNFQAD